jgi:hypothetical protein
LTVLSSDQAFYMTLGAVGSCTQAVSQPVVACPVAGSGGCLEDALRAAGEASTASESASGAGAHGASLISYVAPDAAAGAGAGAGAGGAAQPPADWQPLVKAGLKALYGVCIRGGPKEQLLGMLNMGFAQPAEQELKVRPAPADDAPRTGRARPVASASCGRLVVPLPARQPRPRTLVARPRPSLQGAIFQTYLTLVGATITAVARDATLQQYLAVSRELQVRRGGVRCSKCSAGGWGCGWGARRSRDVCGGGDGMRRCGRHCGNPMRRHAAP